MQSNSSLSDALTDKLMENNECDCLEKQVKEESNNALELIIREGTCRVLAGYKRVTAVMDVIQNRRRQTGVIKARLYQTKNSNNQMKQLPCGCVRFR